MTFKPNDINSPEYKAELDRQMQMAVELKNRYDEQPDISIHQLWFSPMKFVIGFNLKTDVSVGNTYFNDDNSRCEVIAIV